MKKVKNKGIPSYEIRQIVWGLLKTNLGRGYDVPFDDVDESMVKATCDRVGDNWNLKSNISHKIGQIATKYVTENVVQVKPPGENRITLHDSHLKAAKNRFES